MPKMYEIIERTEVAPNTVLFKIYAPYAARGMMPGQFIILRAAENGERIPISISGWNAQEGWIRVIIMAAGQSTREATALQQGDCFTDVVGPLGRRSHTGIIDGTVVVIGGGYGAGAVIPTAAEMKALGNKVIGIVGARSAELVLMDEELAAICDETIVTTNDGSKGREGLVTNALNDIMQREKVGYVLAIGPVPMMKAVSELTRESGITTWVSLNAIMVDGTGMCGACRVSVGEGTKFACFHGPDFNGHEVNFDELTRRQKMFKDLEQQAISACAGGC